MKVAMGWVFPDGEAHMDVWMASPKGHRMINGRAAYQGAKQEAVRRVCVDLTHMRTAVDCGGHIGTWSFNLAHWFKRVHAFEPVADHRACFEKNVTLPNVTLHACALGRTEGKISIHTSPTSTGDSWVKGAGNIPMVTLDSLELEEVDLIKVDTEGFEENVMRGAEKTINQWRPVIIVEQKRAMATKFDLRPLGAVEYLQSLGYRQHSEISGDHIMVPR